MFIKSIMVNSNGLTIEEAEGKIISIPFSSILYGKVDSRGEIGILSLTLVSKDRILIYKSNDEYVIETMKSAINNLVK